MKTAVLWVNLNVGGWTPVYEARVLATFDDGGEIPFNAGKVFRGYLANKGTREEEGTSFFILPKGQKPPRWMRR